MSTRVDGRGEGEGDEEKGHGVEEVGSIGESSPQWVFLEPSQREVCPPQELH